MRHDAQRSSSTWAVTADNVNCGWDRNVVALEAAAKACEIDSGNSLGLWAVPANKNSFCGHVDGSELDMSLHKVTFCGSGQLYNGGEFLGIFSNHTCAQRKKVGTDPEGCGREHDP